MPNYKRLSIQANKEIVDNCRIAAAIEGLTLNSFIVSALNAAAQSSIAKADIVRLNPEDAILVAKAIAEPPVPNAALQRAMEYQSKLLS